MRDSVEAKYDAARSILAAAGALSECDIHGYAIVGNSEIEEAYRLGNDTFSVGGVFSTKREMTDTIKHVYDDTLTDCIGCDQVFGG